MTVSADDLAAERAEQETGLPELATVEESTRVGNGQGGTKEAWRGRGQPLPCRLAAPSARERIVAEQAGTKLDAVVTFAWNADVRDTDRLVIAGTTYHVTGRPDRHSWATALRLMVAKVR